MSDSPITSSNELLSFVGMEIQALLKQGYSPSATKHLVSSQLVECIMETIAPKSDGEYDQYALKPLLVAVKYMFELESSKKKEADYIPAVRDDLASIKQVTDYLEHRISVIKEEPADV